MLDAEDIGRALSSYLGAPAARVSVLASGWETTDFEFTLDRESHVCASIPVGQPMLLRFYEGSAAANKGIRVHITIDRRFAAGFPFPRPYAFAPYRRAPAAPCLVMQRLYDG